MSLAPSLLSLDRPAALVLAIALETELLPLRDFETVSLSALMSVEKPPFWLIALVSARDKEGAVTALDNVTYSPPFEVLPDRSDLVVAALFLRHQAGRLPWSDFLSKSGLVTDGQAGKRECEYFYAMLNELETSSDARLATQQQAEISRIYATDTNRVQAVLRLAGI